ncbi:MAG: protein-L-isoaspartate(D-aspartate) O-methyltransferase [Nitrospiraceae bacterium]|nr:protein-L-isoaspartate(D-aspartate) O-methyltransferase [Nitrospiraceae bacterium]
MAEYRDIREHMVRTQLIPRGIKDPRVLDAMRRTPRHLFLDESMREAAYTDSALPIGEGQTISQPYMVAVMTELLELDGHEKVLEIGTGTGYQAAVLAELAREVFTMERISVLAARAEERFRELHYSTIRVRVGDGTLGWPEEAPFNGVIITAASPRVPEPLIDQLADNGILIIPVGSRYSQHLLKIRKTDMGLTREIHTPCVFVPLIGEHGWAPEG